jgi:hypothetical protein
MATAPWTHDRIQTLRIKAREGDKPALRLALMQSLASLNLHPPGMPPSAIFMIRFLNDPLPGSLISKKKSKNAWRDALHDNLTSIYREAAKPVRCALQGNPPAVVFRDQAELLACLLADIGEHRVAHNWWWRNRHFSSPHISQRIRDVLIMEVRYAPAAFSHLAQAEKALNLIKQVEPAHAGEILQAMLGEFSLGELWALMTAAESEFNPLDLRTTKEAEGTDKSGHDQYGGIHPHSLPPWSGIFTEEIWQADLHRNQAALLGVARMLHQRPAMMRNRIFLHSVAQWWADSNHIDAIADGANVRWADSDEISASVFQNGLRDKTGLPNDTQIDRTKAIEHPATDIEHPATDYAAKEYSSLIREHDTESTVDSVDFLSEKHQEDPGIFPREINMDDSSGALEVDISSVQRQSATVLEEDNDRAFERGFSASAPEEIPKGLEDSRFNDSNDAVPADTEPTAKTYSEKFEAELPEEHLDSDDEVNLHFSDTWVDTHIGGILFLINLLRQLDMPQAFDDHWRLGQQISPWALVDLFARTLLGKQFSDFYTDPVWRIIAKLDGRRTKLKIAKKFVGQANYHIPLAWYQWLKVDKVYWATSGRRLRIWTEACVLVETTYEDDAYQSCITELQPYEFDHSQGGLQQGAYRSAPLAARSHLLAAGINPDFARLLAVITPFVQTFLKQQLQLKTTDKRALVRELLLLDSRIYLSSSHIDLVANIEQTNFRLRCAGLDQDPGWLPDYGRVVLIHFS